MRAVMPLILIAFAACAKEGAKPDAGQPKTPTFARELKVDLSSMQRRASGLYLLDVAQGSGPEATAGQTAKVHYTGWLADGRQFDSSRGGEGFEFVLGQGQVIAGWDEGVAGMKVGGKRRLVLPPDLGYGDAGAGGVIPPGATLVFDVELLELK